MPIRSDGQDERASCESRCTGDRVGGENVVVPGAGGPPTHVHHRQVEALTVKEGRTGSQRPGEVPRYAGPGEKVVCAVGEVHRFWNAGTSDLRCTAHIEPARSIEYFLGQRVASRRRSGRPQVDAFDAAFLTRRGDTEFQMLVLPLLVQQIAFFGLVFIGRLRGRYGAAPMDRSRCAFGRARPDVR
ncbi:MAG: cupin domain-containing protein [Cryobacterium sp.]|nr:cupin domain-containing protein [Cryobacterium sp.]